MWNGQERLSIIIKNTRPAGVDDDTMVKCVKLYDKIELRSKLTSEEIEFATPERPLFARLYTYLKKNQGLSMNSFEYMANKVCENGDNMCKVRVALLALIELGIVNYDTNGDLFVPEVSAKFDLADAPVMQYLSEVK